MKYLVSNLKANFTLNDMEVYLKALENIDTSKVNLIVCPSALYLYLFKDAKFGLGAQDVSVYPKGAYTGEITAKQFSSMGCKYAIIGHYERKKYFFDSDRIIIDKIRNCLDNHMKVIFCVGESINDLRNEEVLSSLETQIANVLNSFSEEDLKNIIIAYEPVWAIGTQQMPTTKAIISTVKFIRKIIKSYYCIDMDVLYGGSISEENINAVKDIKEIDGIVIGASSLNVNAIINIINKL